MFDLKNLLERSVYYKFRNDLTSKPHQMSENAPSLVLSQTERCIPAGRSQRTRDHHGYRWYQRAAETIGYLLGKLAQTVAGFSDFSDANDSHSEHDFGAFEFHGHKVFWKIDYYDLDYHGGSDDPSDLSKTCRLLSIMLAEEC